MSRISRGEDLYCSFGEDLFILKTNRADEKPGIWTLVQILSTSGILDHGDSTDHHDEHLTLSKMPSNNTLKHIYRLVVSESGDKYLNRPPTLVGVN